jgi:hypothetical protein
MEEATLAKRPGFLEMEQTMTGLAAVLKDWLGAA